MGRIEADIALESWLFGFRPCSGQGQFTLLAKMRTEPKMRSQLSTAVSASFPMEINNLKFGIAIFFSKVFENA